MSDGPTIDDALARVDAPKPPRRGVARSGELRRIVAIPRRVLDLSTVEEQTWKYQIRPCACPGCDLCRDGLPRLRPIQSAILSEAASEYGALGPIAVGDGKTLASLLLGRAMGITGPIVLLVPPAVKGQLIFRDMPRYAAHFDVPLERIHVVAYSELSQAKHADVLERIRPALIVADEAHALRDSKSARTKRFYRYMKANPACRFVALSGTMTTRSVKDYARLASLALGSRSPLPISYGDLEEWAAALDPDVVDPMDPGALLELCEPGENVRAGFSRRLVETRGVVSSGADALGVSLILNAPQIVTPIAISTALDALEKTWRIGDEEIESAAEYAAQARRLSLGFYYVWDWNGPVDDAWLRARADWRCIVRDVLQHRSRAGLDSPLLVANAAERGELRGEEIDAWRAWCAVKERPQPPTIPVWIDRFAIKLVLDWAADASTREGRSVIWYESRAVERELRRSTTIPVFGGGDDEGILTAADLEGGPKVIAASIRAHHEGKNLQAFSRALVLGSPASARTWEQMIGRLHRPGQRADEVWIDVLTHTDAVRGALLGAVERARFIEETTKHRQKLLSAQRIGW